MNSYLNLYELPSWRIVSIGRERRNGEELKSLTKNVGEAFSSWFNELPDMISNHNRFSLSHGAIWNSKSCDELYLKDFHLFSLIQQKIFKLAKIWDYISLNKIEDNINFSLGYLPGGLYLKTTAKEYSGIPYSTEAAFNSLSKCSDFEWTGGSCIEIYSEPYPKKISKDAIQVFIPVRLNGKMGGNILSLCSYCGSYYLHKQDQLKNCCNSNLIKVRFDVFGKSSFIKEVTEC